MESNARLRGLPSVERLSSRNTELNHYVRVRIAREILAKHREGARGEALIDVENIERDFDKACQMDRPYRPVINATGIVLHTNLGRAPLGREMVHDLQSLEGYLELEFKQGKRSDRAALVERELALLSDAESAVVVNNNAAALVLMLHALANKKEVVVSRGELVQIGGGFRIPEILKSTGARLVEVGTTNITTAEDYEGALGPKTAMILRINPSNFVVSGHTEQAENEALSRMAASSKVLFAYDEGSGDLDRIRQVVDRCDLICFSGDKLLGGPQAGLIVGRTECIDRIKRSPLYRALRPGKIELVLLERCLRRRLHGKKSVVDELVAMDEFVLEQRTFEFQKSLAILSRVKSGEGRIGGGSKPSEVLTSWLIEISGDEERLSRELLRSEPPIVVRKDKGVIQIDLRTVFRDEEPVLKNRLEELKGVSN